jgi:hypothetical protein
MKLPVIATANEYRFLRWTSVAGSYAVDRLARSFAGDERCKDV